MEEMLAKRDALRLPLKNHNYLKQVAWNMADQEDAKAEQTTRENEASSSHRPVRTGPDDGLLPLERAYLQKHGHLPNEQPLEEEDGQ